jgi:hypothetical protein
MSNLTKPMRALRGISQKNPQRQRSAANFTASGRPIRPGYDPDSDLARPLAVVWSQNSRSPYSDFNGKA